MGDAALLRRMLRDERIDAVLHFAGSIVVEDSVAQPIAYYRNNLENSINLFEACLACGIKRLVFSSTAAVYGDPETCLLRNQHRHVRSIRMANRNS